MNINQLLDVIDEALEDGRPMPFTDNRRLVDVDVVQDALDGIRQNLPEEIRQAKEIVNDRNNILGQARREAEAIVREARERAAALTSEQQITKAAQAKAVEILSNAQNEARQMRSSVIEYCDNKLKALEENITHTTADVKTLRASLRQKNS